MHRIRDRDPYTRDTWLAATSKVDILMLANLAHPEIGIAEREAQDLTQKSSSWYSRAWATQIFRVTTYNRSRGLSVRQPEVGG